MLCIGSSHGTASSIVQSLLGAQRFMQVSCQAGYRLKAYLLICDSMQAAVAVAATSAAAAAVAVSIVHLLLICIAPSENMSGLVHTRFIASSS